MPIEFTEQAAKLTATETDKKVVGVQNPDPIAQLDIEMNVESAQLAMFSPTLRSMLFHLSGAVQHDLADQAHDAPDVRFPELKYPLKWEHKMEDAIFTIHRGLGGKSDLVFDKAVVKHFGLTPKQGGTVAIHFRVRSTTPNKAAFGALADLLKTDIAFSLALAPDPDPDE